MMRQESGSRDDDETDPNFFGTELTFADMNQSNVGPDEVYDRRDDTMGYFVDDDFDESLWLEEKGLYRVKTAPARPLTDLEEFRRSKAYIILERAVVASTELVHTYSNKYDIDSEEGRSACKTFLKILEKLQECYGTTTASREYRESFSNAYRFLYTDDSLAYLMEILDSAQEAVPCLYVNGTRFEFSILVIEAGHRLFQSFVDIQNMLKKNFIKAQSSESSAIGVKNIKTEVKKGLEAFDKNWVKYEELYVKELMEIESQARKLVIDAIMIEKQLTILEEKEKARGRILLDSEEYDKLRRKFAYQIAKINSVANNDGKGRDDLEIDILIAAEGILRRISPSQSMSVRKLADNIRTSFSNLRSLLKKYGSNVEFVDPQLKNNPDLVNELMLYEKYWERGKHYFLNGKRCAQLIHFSNTLEGLCEKYESFKEKIEYREADIFVTIPMIIILKGVEGTDKDICEHFLPELKDVNIELGQMYYYIKDTLFKSNSDISNKKRRGKSIGRSLRFSKKSDILEDRAIESEDDPMTKSLHIKRYKEKTAKSVYKTLLGNRMQYSPNSKIIQAPKTTKTSDKFDYGLYNVIEKKILGISFNERDQAIYSDSFEILDGAVHKIKILAAILERNNPMEWNTFLDVALEN